MNGFDITSFYYTLSIKNISDAVHLQIRQKYFYCILFRGQNSLIGIIGLDDPRFESRQWQKCLPSPKGPEQLWPPPSFLFSGHLGDISVMNIRVTRKKQEL
jgi:hypothetical protein